jgi:hypothetical protein
VELVRRCTCEVSIADHACGVPRPAPSWRRSRKFGRSTRRGVEDLAYACVAGHGVEVAFAVPRRSAGWVSDELRPGRPRTITDDDIELGASTSPVTWTGADGG